MPKVAPNDFTTFLGGVVLQDISLWASSTIRLSDRAGGKRKFLFGESNELVSADKKSAVVLATYGVQVLDDDDQELAVMEVTWRVQYETPQQMTEEIFEVFRGVSLRLHTVPFAREWFRDQSARMGLEPILLPLALAHPAAVKPRPSEKPKAKPAPVKGRPKK